MNLLLLVALALHFGCLALLSFLALLGVLVLAGALRGVAAIRASVGSAGRGLVDYGGQVRAANPLAGSPPARSW